MKLLQALIVGLAIILLPQMTPGQRTSAANRAWKPFFAAFQAAVQKRDREALSKMLSKDFYYLSSGGDENGNGDTRDEAFEYWQTTNIGPWEALDKVLAQGTVPTTVMRDPLSRRPNRVAPPIANNRRAIKQHSFQWYAVFEYRDGQWYCIRFTECCD